MIFFLFFFISFPLPFFFLRAHYYKNNNNKKRTGSSSVELCGTHQLDRTTALVDREMLLRLSRD